MSLFELETKEQKQRALMALYGVFIILPIAFFATLGGFFITGDSNMAMAVGFSAMLVVGGTMGYFTEVVTRAVQEVNIRIVKEN